MSAKGSGARGVNKRAVLVSSPNAGGAAHGGNLSERLGRVGVTVASNLGVSELDRAQSLGKVWREQSYDLAIAAGGDGTVGAVASHLAGSGLPLAILPLGTANDVARSLHLPMDIAEACAAVAGATPMDIDVGEVVPGLTEPLAYSVAHGAIASADDPSPVAGVSFLHALTLGLNVEFARLATDSLRRQRLGSLTYAASALEAVTHYRPVDVTLHVYGFEGTGAAGVEDMAEEKIIHACVVQVCVVNTPVFGGRMGVRLPDVSLHDRKLDFMVIEAIDAQQLRHAVQQLLAALSGAPDHSAGVAGVKQVYEAPHLPGVWRFRARGAVIETTSAVDVTLDGEIRTHTPVVVRVAPESLRVLVPPQAKLLLTRDGQQES